MGKKGMNVLFIIIGASVLVGIALFFILTVFNSSGTQALDKDTAIALMGRYYNNITVTTDPLIPGSLEFTNSSLWDSLPSIDKYPPQVNPTTNDYIEIMSSTEKSTISNDAPNDRWLIDVAESFNKSGITVDGRKVSVMIRSIASGLGKDYIVSGKHIPDVFTPSNEIWGEAIASEGIEIFLAKKRLVGNVAGIVLTQEANQRIVNKYGAITTETIDKAVINGELSFGYTNPLSSSAGMNKLLSTLYSINKNDPLSSSAANTFEQFQSNIKYTAYTTLQMQNSAVTGRLEGFVSEAQQFKNSKDLKSFVFTPFGVRHDSPVYTFGSLSPTQTEILEAFLDFCDSPENQNLASGYGFNQYDDYSDTLGIDGAITSSAQKLWKEKKSGYRDVVAVFIADISGSMSGAPLNSLQNSLLNSMQYIGEGSHIGLVTFSNTVNIALPLEQFDLDHMSHFSGAIGNMASGGGTAMYDAIVVACKMLVDYQELHPGIKPIIFVLTDGESNVGLGYNKVERMLAGLQIPINTISYNGKHPSLDELANINEAAAISADDEDIVYKLGAFFNAEL